MYAHHTVYVISVYNQPPDIHLDPLVHFLQSESSRKKMFWLKNGAFEKTTTVKERMEWSEYSRMSESV